MKKNAKENQVKKNNRHRPDTHTNTETRAPAHKQDEPDEMLTFGNSSFKHVYIE